MKTKLLFFICIALFAAKANAQYLQDINGRILRETQYIDLDGSPYLVDEWSKGSVQLSDRKVYKNIDLKYNQIDDILLFMNPKGEPCEFVQGVISFEIAYTINGKVKAGIYRNGFSPVDENTEASYYAVLCDGATKLLKRTKKTVKESKAYSSATLVKTIVQNTNYYLVSSDGIQRVKPDQKSIQSILHDKAAEIANYLKENKLNLKDDVALARLVEYYNSLKTN